LGIDDSSDQEVLDPVEDFLALLRESAIELLPAAERDLDLWLSMERCERVVDGRVDVGEGSMMLQDSPNWPEPACILIIDRYGADGFSDCQDLLGDEIWSARALPLRSWVEAENSALGFNLILEPRQILGSRVDRPDSARKRRSALLVAALAAEALGDVIVADEAWSEPLQGVCRGEDVLEILRQEARCSQPRGDAPQP
jgi:hypothetical protein